MNKMVILGGGAFARELMWLIESIGSWEILGFIREEKAGSRTKTHGYEDFPSMEDFLVGIKNREGVHYCFGTGSPSIKRKMETQARSHGLHPAPPLVHPGALMHRSVKLAENVVVCAGSVLTVDITVGYGTMFNLNCSVGHDCTIGEFCTFNPGTNISGNVKVEDGVECGTNVSIIPGVTIGRDTVIGASAAVVKSVPDGVTVVGIPAKPIRHHNDHKGES